MTQLEFIALVCLGLWGLPTMVTAVALALEGAADDPRDGRARWVTTT